MAKKKLGISTIEINKKFTDREHAYKYARRLKEFIRYTCKKNAGKGWYAQAIIITSNTQGKANYQMYYARTGKVGRPKRAKDVSSYYEKWFLGDISTSWHIHVLLVSKPTFTFREAIKKYIDTNWIDLPQSHNYHFNYAKYKSKKVYKKNCNINLSQYLFLQCEDILFCDYNFTEENPIQYNLKDLFREFMKVSTFKKYNAKKYWQSIEVQEIVEETYNLILSYFRSLSYKHDKQTADNFLKKVSPKITETLYIR